MSLQKKDPMEGQWDAVEERGDKEEDEKYSDGDEGKWLLVSNNWKQFLIIYYKTI